MYSSGCAPGRIAEASPKGSVPKSRSKIPRGSIVDVRKGYLSIPRIEDTEIGFPASGNTGPSLTEVGNHNQVIYLPIDG